MCLNFWKLVSDQWNKIYPSTTTNEQQQLLPEDEEMGRMKRNRRRLPRGQSYSPGPSGQGRKRQKSSPPFLWIRYGKKHPFKQWIPTSQHYHNVTVNDVKVWCKNALNIPLRTMKLQYNGGFLNNGTATLESLGILPDQSTLDVFGDQVTEDERLMVKSGHLEEVGACQTIQNIMKKLPSWENRLTLLEQPDEQKHLVQDLMDALLALDDVECPLVFETARLDRRQGIRTCQDLLDQVNAWQPHEKQL